MKDTIILVHGFNKSGSDMLPLEKHLAELGYNTVTLNLPTRFRKLEDCANKLKYDLEEITCELGELGIIHFVGHSMGGLIIRQFLANNYIANLGRCVFIATPNKGTRLADLVEELCSPLVKIFKPIEALTSKGANSLPKLNKVSTEVGVIAGRKSNLLLGVFLLSENDGRVEVDKVKLSGMKDFRVLNYGHKEIHKNSEVASLIDVFLQTGSFKRGASIEKF